MAQLELKEDQDYYIVLDSEGMVVTIKDQVAVKSPFKEAFINPSELFLFWSSSQDELKSFITAVEAFGGENPFKDLDINDMTFLQIKQEDGELYLC